MPFIPHTPEDERLMLERIGVDSIEALFSEIPDGLRAELPSSIPPGLDEMALAAEMARRADENVDAVCFAGAGAYDHHIPSAVWELACRGEFYSAYTPYQAEASQGTLQLVYEYQTMMARLMAMDVSNASLYDGATALAEAVLMAVRANRRSRSRRVLVPRTVHPRYLDVVRTIVTQQGITVEALDYDPAQGITALDRLPAEPGGFAALVVPQPNYFGCLEPVDELSDWARERGALVIGLANPIAMALLRPPGEWGQDGADIACGDGQPLGIPMASGGPYFGFICCRQALVRQLPGRIVGRTLDLEGRPGYTLTLQAREQHIRRSRATSNICTNQGLMVTAATIHMAIMGDQGLRSVARACHGRAMELRERLAAIDGVEFPFSAPIFHEQVVRFPGRDPAPVLDALWRDGMLGGRSLGDDYPALGDALLVCTTERRQADEIAHYARVVAGALGGDAGS